MAVKLEPSNFIYMVQMSVEDKAIRLLLHGHQGTQTNGPSPALGITRHHESVAGVDLQEFERISGATHKSDEVIQVKGRFVDSEYQCQSYLRIWLEVTESYWISTSGAKFFWITLSAVLSFIYSCILL